MLTDFLVILAYKATPILVVGASVKLPELKPNLPSSNLFSTLVIVYLSME